MVVTSFRMRGFITVGIFRLLSNPRKSIRKKCIYEMVMSLNLYTMTIHLNKLCDISYLYCCWPADSKLD